MGKIVGIIVVLIVILGGIWYVMNMNAPAADTGAQTGAAADAMGSTSPQATSGTIGSLMAMGDVTCTVNLTDESGGEGTVYVSGGKMAGDFTMTTGGQTMNAHMINDSKFIYTWSDAAPQGMKMAVPAASTTAPAASSQGLDANTPVNYSCSPWTPDASKFVPPTSIKFMSMPAAAMH